jgi:uncharacterized protein YjiS (DUF1127 family)
MTMISSTPARSGAGVGFARWRATVGNSIAAWWLRREAIKALRKLDDRELRDIGLARCHIEAAVGGALNPDMARFR